MALVTAMAYWTKKVLTTPFDTGSVLRWIIPFGCRPWLLRNAACLTITHLNLCIGAQTMLAIREARKTGQHISIYSSYFNTNATQI